jgi:hypothetical protein
MAQQQRYKVGDTVFLLEYDLDHGIVVREFKIKALINVHDVQLKPVARYRLDPEGRTFFRKDGRLSGKTVSISSLTSLQEQWDQLQTKLNAALPEAIRKFCRAH